MFYKKTGETYEVEINGIKYTVAVVKEVKSGEYDIFTTINFEEFNKIVEKLGKNYNELDNKIFMYLKQNIISCDPNIIFSTNSKIPSVAVSAKINW